MMVHRKIFSILTIVIIIFLVTGCGAKNQQAINDNGKIRLMVLDPGHFHASLVLKVMYPEVDSTVYVYAPDGMELSDFLARVESYNTREESPTAWNVVTYKGDNFLEKMVEEQPGNLVVLAGNNRDKTGYIEACIDAGLHVYSDKPMAIDPAGFERLTGAFEHAEEQRLLLYDIMTERFEITTILQKTISEEEHIFGELVHGTVVEPAITKESVHHFFKYVSGAPLLRPAWFFDVSQEGEAIADVGTHLVDLVLWEAVPDGIRNREEQIQIVSSKRWTTDLSPEQFGRVTGSEVFPEFLTDYITSGTLRAMANSSVDFRVKDIHAHVSVEWAFEAPEGTGDTHYSIMRGSLSDLIIKQGAAENYRPELYIRASENADKELIEVNLQLYLNEVLNEKYPGMAIEKVDAGTWKINIPNKFREGHEAHFARVTEKFLEYMENGEVPPWEIDQMIAKYYTTTMAVKMAQ
ncbi:MAG: putative oxidoreductase C-terminal domain-containing protein [Bacteroidales bacterium]